MWIIPKDSPIYRYVPDMGASTLGLKEQEGGKVLAEQVTKEEKENV